MTIWINNPFDFLPGEGARLQRYGLLAQALVKAGHQVVWWSSDWNHIKKEKREEKCANVGMRECANVGEGSVEIRLIKTMPYYKNIGLRRLLSHWLYARSWEREARSACGNEVRKQRCETPMLACPDLIICSAPPLSTGWVMRGICKRLGCIGVIDVMDVWPETFERVVPAWMLWPLRLMAKRVYERADGVSAVGDSYLEVVERYLGGTAKPLYRCYHGIEMGGEVLKFESSKVLKLGEKLETGNLKLVYVGNMGKGYDLVTLVRVVKEMIDEGHAISLDLAGSGEQEEILKSLVQQMENIRFHGVVTGDALRTLLVNADVGMVPMFANTYVAVPYKLADYAAAGLPVISSLKGETEDLINKYDAGWFYDAGDCASLRNAILLALQSMKAPDYRIDQYGMHSRQMAAEIFDAEKIYPEFVKWLELQFKRRMTTNMGSWS